MDWTECWPRRALLLAIGQSSEVSRWILSRPAKGHQSFSNRTRSSLDHEDTSQMHSGEHSSVRYKVHAAVGMQSHAISCLVIDSVNYNYSSLLVEVGHSLPT